MSLAEKRRRFLYVYSVIVMALCGAGCTPSYPHNAALDAELALLSQSHGLGLLTTSPTSETLPLMYFDGTWEQLHCCGRFSRSWVVSGGRKLFTVDISNFLFHPGEPPFWSPNTALLDLPGMEQRRLPCWIVPSFVAVSGNEHMIAFSGFGAPPYGAVSNFPTGLVFGVLGDTRFREIYHDLQANMVQSEKGPETIAWSPDAKEIVYGRKGIIWIYNLERDQSRSVAKGSNPLWSPDGRWISYRGPNGEAIVIATSGSERKILMPGRVVSYALHWSPDGQYILMTIELHEDFVLWGQPIVYRLRDGATTPAGPPTRGLGDNGMEWVMTRG